MIKRETLTRLIYHTTQDQGGGYEPPTIEQKETIPASVSIDSSMEQITAYGRSVLDNINVVSNISLDTSANARYSWNNKHYRVLNQIKRGNEWFATLQQVNE